MPERSPLAVHYHYLLIVLCIFLVHCLDYVPNTLRELFGQRNIIIAITNPFLRITYHLRGQLARDTLSIQPNTDLAGPIPVHAHHRHRQQ